MPRSLRPLKITAAKLRAAKACQREIDRFRLRFPKGAKITYENLCSAQSAGLNLPWFYLFGLPRILGRSSRVTRISRTLEIAGKALHYSGIPEMEERMVRFRILAQACIRMLDGGKF